ncbi:cyclopropane fatty-acyl-phospholipid synthase-like methyltransferase [Paenibacillus sacheonensis]|nr:cyclopropane fatty-acyl-phospholipid synthase-like methyltransferase [Paenibacillus sacheonensis]
MELLAEFEGYDELRVLDLGCGIGRNSIPIAQSLLDRRGSVVCVDLLESAMASLAVYSRQYGVESYIRPIHASIEDYRVEPENFDYIVAVSALEHVCSQKALRDKLAEITRGTKPGGINCLIIGTGSTETAADTGEMLDPLFEVNLPTAEMLRLLDEQYAGWEFLLRTVKPLVFEIDRQGRPVKLASDCVTFAARKPAV